MPSESPSPSTKLVRSLTGAIYAALFVLVVSLIAVPWYFAINEPVLGPEPVRRESPRDHAPIWTWGSSMDEQARERCEWEDQSCWVTLHIDWSRHFEIWWLPMLAVALLIGAPLAQPGSLLPGRRKIKQDG